MNITIYTIPNCKNCDEVKNYFDSKDIEYKVIDMSKGGNKKTIELKKKLKSLGFKTYPIIIIQPDGDDEMMFPEFDKELIEDLINDEKRRKEKEGKEN